MKKNNSGVDGIDHINIYSQGKTELGRLLSNFAYSPIWIDDEIFYSIEGYWYWLGCTHPRRSELRKAFGVEAKQLGRQLRGKNANIDPQFKLKICKALLEKLLKNEKLYSLFVSNKLPFKHYYVYGDKRVNVPNCDWIVEIWTFLQKLVGTEK